MFQLPRRLRNRPLGDKPGDWMENVQNLADGVHFALSYGVLLTTFYFTNSWWWIGGVEAFLTAFVLAKEYWYDLRYETGETWKSSTIDALGWLVGNGVCWGVYSLHRWVAR